MAELARHFVLGQGGQTVTLAGSAVGAQWQQRVLTYAHALQAILGP